MSYRHGCTRVSASAQDPPLQLDSLHSSGVDLIHVDCVPRVATNRPEFSKMLGNARPRETIVVWRLPRLGRSRNHLLEWIEALEELGVAFVPLSAEIDAGANGRLVLRLLSALASLERGLLAERTRAALDGAPKRGCVNGRPKALTPTAERADTDLHHCRRTVTLGAQTPGVAPATTYRYTQRVSLPASAVEAEE